MIKKLAILAVLGGLAYGLYYMVTPHAVSGIQISDAFMRKNGTAATAGAAFMTITNGGPADRLIGAEVDFAKMAEIHTHIMDANGVMMMREIEGGLAIGANSTAVLARGGDHVMIMGITGPVTEGEIKTLRLIFENAGPIDIQIPVDQNR